MTDNRRLTLWVAFGLVLLGGSGSSTGPRRRSGVAWALALVARPGRRARDCWLWRSASAASSRGSAPGPWHTMPKPPRRLRGPTRRNTARAERQVRLTLTFLPRYLGLAGGHLLGLVALAALWRRGRVGARLVRPVLLGLTLVDLFGFGVGLNPAIAAADDRPESPGDRLSPPRGRPVGRILGLGEELPPNTLMRYGLADVRNYDSVELARSLDWFAPLYDEPSPRPVRAGATITWDGVLRGRERLREAGGRRGRRGDPASRRRLCAGRARGRGLGRPARWPGRWSTAWRGGTLSRRLERPGFDPHSRSMPGRRSNRRARDLGPRLAGRGRRPAVPVEPHRGAFLAVPVPAGRHELVLRYDPPEVPHGGWSISVFALAAAVFALTGFRPVPIYSNYRRRAWTDPSRRVRIGLVILTGFPPANH